MLTLRVTFLIIYCLLFNATSEEKQLDQKPIEMPALGRPFYLGMLYDIRTDTIVTGVTLWDPQNLTNNTFIHRKSNTEFEVITEDSFQKKAHALGVEASLKLSMLSGLIKMSGSAKFAEDKQQTSHAVRMTLKSSTTTHTEQLTMKDLRKGNYPEIRDLNFATHVVTGVTYGAEAFFVFDRTISIGESRKEIGGSLNAILNKLSQIGIEDNAKFNLTAQESNFVNKLNCKFYGDYRLKANPSTFAEAVKLYRELPKLVGEKGENTVPKRVSLYPLGLLDSRAARYVREISSNLVDYSISMIEKLHLFEIRARDLSESDVLKNLNYMKQHLLDFAARVSEIQLDLKQNIASYLPKLRGTGAEESDLFNVFKELDSSPYNQRKLASWLQDKGKEIDLITSWIDNIANNRNLNVTLGSLSLQKFLGDTNYDYIVCLLFRFAEENDPQVNDMYNYRYHRKEFNSSKSHSKRKIWLDDRRHIIKVRNNLRQFVEFAAANNVHDGKIKFIVDEEYATDSNKGVEMIVYVNGLKHEGFIIPSKPGKPYATSVTFNSVTLKWTDAAIGTEKVVKYKVMYRKHNHMTKKEDEWTEVTTTTNEKKKIINNLPSNTTFEFRVQSVTAIGFSAASDISKPIATAVYKRKKPSKLMCLV